VSHVLTDLGGPIADELERFQETYQNDEGFRSVVFDGDSPIIVVDSALLDQWQKRIGGAARVVASCVPANLVSVALGSIEDVDVREGQYAAAGYDALVDAVRVVTPGDVEDASTLILDAAGIDPQAGKASASELLRVIHTDGGTPRLSRTADSSPFWGGAKTRIERNGNLYGFCSSGFYVSSATFGTAMLTAGHCGINSDVVRNGNDTATVGAIEGRHFSDPDLALIDGSAYAPVTYGWNDQTTTRQTTQSGEPTTGVVYCQFGYASLRICSSYSMLDYTLVDDVGHPTRHLAYTSGPSGPSGSLGTAGDSGGGVFRELGGEAVGARGTVVGGLCDASTCWRADHRLGTILAYYDATVVLH
jgi:hypothetical protein